MGHQNVVYWLYDVEGSLLYVGQTSTFENRLFAHRLQQPWRARIDNWVTVLYPDRTTAVAAERLAILRDCPEYNVQVLNPWKVPHQQQRWY